MKLKSVIIWSIVIAAVLFGVLVMPLLSWNNLVIDTAECLGGGQNGAGKWFCRILL